MNDVVVKLEALSRQVETLARKIDALVAEQAEKEWYTVDEVALLVRRARWTVREWCRDGRVRAKKLAGSDKWMIGREELRRLRAEGLRPTQ